MANHRKALVSGLEGVVGVLRLVLGAGYGVFVDWDTFDGNNSLQGVFLPDPGIKASIKRTLCVSKL